MHFVNHQIGCRIMYVLGGQNGFYDKLHFFALFRSEMKTFIWDCYFPASNRPKVLKSGKSAEKSTWVVNERSGPRKPSINDSVLKGLGGVRLNDCTYANFSLFFALFALLAPSPRPAGRGRPRPASEARIHGSQPPDPWVPASGSMDPSLRIHGSQPPDP